MPRRDGTGPRWFCGELRGSGRRLTAPREMVLEIMSTRTDHPSAEEVYREARRKCPKIGLTTIYRSLDLLVEMGLLSRHDFGDGRARYEMVRGTPAEGHHHHLVCTECRRVVNYRDFMAEEIDFLKKAEKGLARKYRFRITDHVIQFHGVCDQCLGAA